MSKCSSVSLWLFSLCSSTVCVASSVGTKVLFNGVGAKFNFFPFCLLGVLFWLERKLNEGVWVVDWLKVVNSVWLTGWGADNSIFSVCTLEWFFLARLQFLSNNIWHSTISVVKKTSQTSVCEFVIGHDIDYIKAMLNVGQ
jgi:hypothetical protein